MVRQSKNDGQAMVELLIAATFVLVPLFLAIPLLGKYLDMRAAAVQTARYAAWERTVWYGGAAASSLGWLGVSRSWQANAKSDNQIRNELGARLLSETDERDAFSSTDRDAGDFKRGRKMLWQDRNQQALLANYSDIESAVINKNAPGTVNKIVKPIADLAATLGPFVLETKGEYAATVATDVRAIDYDRFIATDSKIKFRETNVLLANGWSAAGPEGKISPTSATMTGVRRQVKGLVPTSLLSTDNKVLGVPIMEYVLTGLSAVLPEVSKFEPGKVEPDLIPPDRKGDK